MACRSNDRPMLRDSTTGRRVAARGGRRWRSTRRLNATHSFRLRSCRVTCDLFNVLTCRLTVVFPSDPPSDHIMFLWCLSGCFVDLSCILTLSVCVCRQFWLDLERPMGRQVDLAPHQPILWFCVKFYTPDPAQLEDEFTRYLFALQVKRDLSQGHLQCNDNTAALMASYIIQGEYRRAGRRPQTQRRRHAALEDEHTSCDQLALCFRLWFDVSSAFSSAEPDGRRSSLGCVSYSQEAIPRRPVVGPHQLPSLDIVLVFLSQ